MAENGVAFTLLRHQSEALEKSRPHPAYGFFMETGTGKTLVGIELMRAGKRAAGRAGWRALVVCPLSIIESVWRQEVAKFAPELRTCNLWKVRAHQAERIPAADVYIINYESVGKVDPRFLSTFDMVLLDESTKIKNPKARITKFMLSMRRFWKRRYVFSGLPAPNNLMEYWAQMCFINPGILGDNFYRFRALNFFNIRGLPYLWAPTSEFKERLPHLLAKQAFVAKKKDCLDLPEQVYQVRSCRLAPAQRRAYDQLLKLNITMLKDKPVLAANELAKIMKLRQVTSGFAVSADGEAQEFKDNSKLKVLEEVLDELGDKQAIIWVQFHKEIEQLRSKLDGSVVLAGTESQTDKERAIDEFKSGRAQYLIAHPRTAGHGLTLVNCSYAIYYSLSYSLEEYKQSQDRIHRIGQKESATYIHLLAEGSIDEVIYKALHGKSNMAEAVLAMVRDLS